MPLTGTLMTSRRIALFSLVASAVAISSPRLATSEEFSLPRARDLRQELAAAMQKQQPLVVMVSLEGCAFCKIARENYLRSLQRDLGLTIVQIDMGKSNSVIDFRGAITTHEKQIKKWGIKLAPTLLFFGREGKELVERLVGGTSSDFYGAYLDERVAKAIQLSKV